MKTNTYFRSYFAQFFLDWETRFRKSCRESKNTYIRLNNFFFSKIVPRLNDFFRK